MVSAIGLGPLVQGQREDVHSSEHAALSRYKIETFEAWSQTKQVLG